MLQLLMASLFRNGPDGYLRGLRFGRDRAESTTEKYAYGIAAFLRWCAATGRDWHEAAADFGLFITWLKYVPTDGGPDRPVDRANRAASSSRPCRRRTFKMTGIFANMMSCQYRCVFFWTATTYEYWHLPADTIFSVDFSA